MRKTDKEMGRLKSISSNLRLARQQIMERSVEETKKQISGERDTGLLIIKIPQNLPVLVYKRWKAQLIGKKEDAMFRGPEWEVSTWAEYGFTALWNDVQFPNMLPPIVEQHYGSFFSKFCSFRKQNKKFPSNPVGGEFVVLDPETEKIYDPEKLPPGCYEVRLRAVKNKHFIPIDAKTEKDVERYKEARSIYRKYKFIPENRGKVKSQSDTIRLRNKVILEEYKNSPKKKPLPVSKISKRLQNRYSEFFPDSPDHFNEFCPSEATIRRVIERGARKK